MIAYGLPMVYVLLLWWFSTGAILFLDGLPRRTYRWSLTGATIVLAISIGVLIATRQSATVFGAYAAFTAAVLAWGWHEITFLMGVLTGPRKRDLPEGCRGWQRFRLAVQTILHHEIGIAVTGLGIAVICWGADNQVGLWSFLALWSMRLSAKFNLFLGVRNWNEDFLPDHLRHLETYFARRSMNPLFPVAILTGSVLAGLLLHGAVAAETGSFEATGKLLVATLLGLAVLEHWFMVLPLPSSALWAWGFRSRTWREEPAESNSEMVVAGDRTEQDVRTWSTSFEGPCDADGLLRVLHAVARGGFGDGVRVSGTARAGAGWVTFYVAGGRAGMAAAAAASHAEGGVTAVGQSVDGPRLKAAFDACAVSVAGTA